MRSQIASGPELRRRSAGPRSGCEGAACGARQSLTAIGLRWAARDLRPRRPGGAAGCGARRAAAAPSRAPGADRRGDARVCLPTTSPRCFLAEALLLIFAKLMPPTSLGVRTDRVAPASRRQRRRRRRRAAESTPAPVGRPRARAAPRVIADRHRGSYACAARRAPRCRCPGLSVAVAC